MMRRHFRAQPSSEIFISTYLTEVLLIVVHE
jgi:hypothetical protein